MFVCLLFYWPFVFLPVFILMLHNLIYQWFIRALISGGKWWWYQQLIYQAPVSLGFARQEHWSGLPFPSSLEILVGIYVLDFSHILGETLPSAKPALACRSLFGYTSLSLTLFSLLSLRTLMITLDTSR